MYSEEILPILLEGRIPLATSKEKDRDATASSGEETRSNDSDVGIPRVLGQDIGEHGRRSKS